MRLLVGSLACSIVLAAAAAAAAGAATPQTLAPPGNSGVDQYFETVPGAGGNVGVRPPPPAANPASSSTAASAAPGNGAAAAQVRTLARFGADGRAAAAVAAATRPSVPAGTGPGARGFTPPPKPTGALSALLTVLGGSDQGGLGIGFPLALAGALAGALLVVALRRRPPRSPG